MARTKRGDPMLVRMTDRGTITLPKELRARAPKADVLEVVLRGDGVFELRPRVMIDPAQAWFWTEEWQAGERRVDAEIAAGRCRTHTAEEFEALLLARMKPND